MTCDFVGFTVFRVGSKLSNVKLLLLQASTLAVIVLAVGTDAGRSVLDTVFRASADLFSDALTQLLEWVSPEEAAGELPKKRRR